MSLGGPEQRRSACRNYQPPLTTLESSIDYRRPSGSKMNSTTQHVKRGGEDSVGTDSVGTQKSSSEDAGTTKLVALDIRRRRPNPGAVQRLDGAGTVERAGIRHLFIALSLLLELLFSECGRYNTGETEDYILNQCREACHWR